MKRVILILMILLLISSWYFVIANGNQKDEQYSRLIKEANEYLSKGIYIDAIESYKRAIEIYPNIIENKLNLANIYKNAKMLNSFEGYCIKLHEEYKDNEKIAIMLGDYYIEIGKEEKAISLYKAYLLQNAHNKIVAEQLNNLKSSYNLDYNGYTYISSFRNGYAVFQKANKYGMMNEKGEVVIKAIYDNAGVYSDYSSLKLAPVLFENEYFYIDLEGNKRLVADLDYKYLGSYSKNGLAVFKNDNYYGYLDSKLTELDTKYDYASSFYENKIAAVKLADKWFLINESLEKINSEYYEEIKIDDLNSATAYNVTFAKKSGKFMMIDISGNMLTNPIFDDVDFFAAPNEYAAVKIDGKWGFVDNKGNIIIKPSYDNAFSFSCGLAPVLIDNKWGYINMDEKLVINPQFNMAKPFNSSGIAPVFKSEWQLLQLKYYDKGGN